MGEEKKPRSSAEIKQEFQGLSFKAGNLQYAIREQQRDLEMINNQLRDLSFEYTAADNAEKEAAKKAAEAAAEGAKKEGSE